MNLNSSIALLNINQSLKLTKALSMAKSVLFSVSPRLSVTSLTGVFEVPAWYTIVLRMAFNLSLTVPSAELGNLLVTSEPGLVLSEAPITRAFKTASSLELTLVVVVTKESFTSVMAFGVGVISSPFPSWLCKHKNRT